MTDPDQIGQAACDCFFPDFSVATRTAIAALLNDGFFDGRSISRVQDITQGAGRLVREAPLRRFFGFVSQLRSSLNYARQGFNPDVLNEFPAQRLIQVRDDVREPVDWKTFWPANGGHLHDGAMVALKWDTVWWRISFLNLPVAPFQLGSGFDLEDVDRDEAEAFGLLKPSTRPPALKIDVDLAELRSRLTAALATAPL